MIVKGENNYSTNGNQCEYDNSNNLDTYFSEKKVKIPETTSNSFSFRKLWAYTGPGFLMSIAYLDPGNIESDLQSGTAAQYKLLWLLLSATLLGLLMQTLATRLGVVTGLGLAEMCYQKYKKVPRLLVWIMVEIAIIGSDIQEVIGTSIAIYLLSARTIPLWIGCIITIVDTFTFLLLDKYGLRKLELFFGFLITVMGISFGYEFIISGPDPKEILKGMFFPWCQDCNYNAMLQAIGIVGAVIMPHNLYLHSALVKSRDIDRTKNEKLKEANHYYFIESSIALLCSFLINVFVVSVFGHGFYQTTNQELLEHCESNGIDVGDIFSNNNEYVSTDIYKGGIFLGCTFGTFAMYIWAVGILAAGQSSTMTGTYVGQFAIEGFLNLRWPRWKRIFIARTIAIIPTFSVAFFSSIEELTSLNDLLNAVMSLQLPFAIIPTIAFTSNRQIMGDFVNGTLFNVSSVTLGFIIMCINTFFLYSTICEYNLHWIILISIGLAAVFYAIFCFYLLIHMAAYMGNRFLNSLSFVQKYVVVNYDNKLNINT